MSKSKYRQKNRFILLLLSAFLVLAVFNFLASYNRQFGNLVARTKFQVREAVEPIIKPIPTIPASPTTKILKGGPAIHQTFNNCGPASLSMVLGYFGINVSQHELGDALRPYQVASGDNDDKSVTLQELAKKAQEYGLKTYWRPNGNIELIKNFINMGVPVMTSTWTHPEEDIGHFRVVKGYDDSKKIIIQDDSLEGANQQYSYADYDRVWDKYNYEYLVVFRPQNQDLVERIIGENLDETIAWQNALDHADNVLGKNPNDVNMRFNKSIAEYYLGKYDETVKDFEAIESNLPFRDLWYQIEPILAYQKLKKYDRVLSLTQRVIDKGNRAFSEAYQIRGEVLDAEGRTEEAKVEYAKVYQYNKNFWKYWE